MVCVIIFRGMCEDKVRRNIYDVIINNLPPACSTRQDPFWLHLYCWACQMGSCQELRAGGRLFVITSQTLRPILSLHMPLKIITQTTALCPLGLLSWLVSTALFFMQTR